jgi:hypothetical protein
VPACISSVDLACGVAPSATMDGHIAVLQHSVQLQEQAEEASRAEQRRRQEAGWRTDRRSLFERIQSQETVVHYQKRRVAKEQRPSTC